MRRLTVLGWMAMAMAMTTACDQGPHDLEPELERIDVEQDEADEADGDYGVEEALAAQPSTQASLQYPQATIVAWSDGSDIRSTAYCTAYTLDATDTNRCACDGLEGLGWTGYDNGTPNKCKMCRDGDWPCSLEPSSGNEVALTFAKSDGVALYSYTDEVDHNTRIDTVADGPWVLSCNEPPASCHNTCDPGGEPCTCAEDSLEFAVSRPYWSGGERHMAAKGGWFVDLGSACD